MANMYAIDFKDVLPGADPRFLALGGGNVWDMTPAFIPAVANYGLTVPMWFCPARSREFNAQYGAAKMLLGHDMTSISDLNSYLASFFGGTNNGFVIMNHNYWVQRSQYGVSIPSTNSSQTVAGTEPALYGWPVKTTDSGSGHVPFISDACFSGYGSPATKNVSDINTSFANNSPLPPAQKYSGHCVGNSLKSVNAAYVDGHVTSHGAAAIQCVFYNNGQQAGWFY
jgi:prepilin-type processing-associated H-X9-DG protein